MEWRIDDSILTTRPKVTKLEIDVDGAAVAAIPNSVHGRFAIPWKKRDVELRRVGPSRGLESALYVDGVLVPPSAEGPGRGERAKCGAHGKRSSRRCPGCDAVVCARCLSVDGVRCEACLEEATAAARSKRRRAWWLGAGFCLAVSIACFFGAAATGHEYLPKAAGTMLFAAGFMVYAGLRSYDGASSARVEPEFEVDDEPPQLTGRRCRACKERIGTAKSADWCPRCRRAFHRSCVTEHDCRPPKRGPDWEAMRRGTGTG